MPRRFTRRSFVVLCVIGVAMLSAWYLLVRPYQEHGRLVGRLERCIIRLAQKRPPETTRDEWSWMLSWTWNAKCNCVSVREYVKDYPRFRRMVAECEQRVDGSVGTDTIDWFWNEIEATSRNGSVYSDRYRPTRPENPFRQYIGVDTFFMPVE